MPNLRLTPDEEKVLRVYAASQPTLGSRLLSWLGQIGLPLACAAYGLGTRNTVFLGAAIGGLVGVMAVRIYYQQQYVDVFRQLCKKIQAHQEATVTDDGLRQA